ncbi:hypothetical protein LguiB_017617 [Lonicera macranthoides]
MTIKANSLPEELKTLILLLASKWGDEMNLKSLNVTHLSGAMTNEVYRVSWPSHIKDVVRTILVRVYGEGVDVFFNRDDEIRTFEFISMHGHGPKLLGHFPGGRVEEFIHARTLSAGDLREPEISVVIATKMREFHNLDVPGPKDVDLWDRMRNWLSKAKNMISSKHAKEFSLENLEEEIAMLEKELSNEYQEIGFCHNDLQYGNIMIDETTKSITIIDYEYANYNPVAYDLACHFCEMAANYHSEMPHIVDYSIYPGLEERQRFVRAYLTSPGHEPSDLEIEKLVNDVEKYTLANHLFWCLWGILSAYMNKIEFDYLEYARQRFQQYWLKKPQILDGRQVSLK